MLEIIAALVGLEANPTPEIHGPLVAPPVMYSPVYLPHDWQEIHVIPCDATTKKEINIPTGLVEVKKENGKKRYKYQISDGGYVWSSKKLRGIPDLRSYKDQHPIWYKIQTGFGHWQPVLQGGSNGAAAGVGLYAIYKIVHPN